MFGTSGIRGPVGDRVTADLALRVGHAVGTDADRVVVGRDPRESGHGLLDAFAAGVRETGGDVVDLGLAATPTVARAVGWFDADAGCSITASHNPPPDNGLKLWQPSGQAFDAPLRERVTARVTGEVSVPLVAWDRQGSRSSADAGPDHVAALVATGDDLEGFSVVVDLGNGAGGVTVEALVDLGADVETLNAQPDGRFPGRPSEPDAETLSSLRALVGATDARLGLAHDGDADRLLAVDETGAFVPKDALLAVFAAAVASEGERVAVPVDTSLAVEDHLAERGIAVERTPVGDVHVAAAVGEDPTVTFGGEPSGAWIFPEHSLCPEGPLAAVRLAGLAADRPLSERVAAVPSYPLRRGNVECEDTAAAMAAVEERVAERFDDGQVSTLDGVRVELEAGWFLVRPSGTQPLVRLTAEARNEDEVAGLFETARGLLD